MRSRGRSPKSSKEDRSSSDHKFRRKSTRGRWLEVFKEEDASKTREFAQETFTQKDVEKPFADEGNSSAQCHGNSEGETGSTPEENSQNNLNPAEITKEFKREVETIATNAYLKMLFEDFFVHGDLHPGNMFWRVKDDGGPELCYLDCGLAVHLNQKDSADFADCVLYTFAVSTLISFGFINLVYYDFLLLP